MPTSRTATSAAMRSVMGRRSRSSHARCRSRARSSTAASARMGSIPNCSVISRLRRVFLQELQHRDFVPPERGGGMVAARPVRQGGGGERRGESLQIRAHQAGVDVVLAAHGARVAEAFRHCVDRADHVALGFALALRRSQRKKLPRREHRARPGPEVLRRDVPAGDLAKIDRKSTRLNSSHGYISYAVFCLKKKKKKKNNTQTPKHLQQNKYTTATD